MATVSDYRKNFMKTNQDYAIVQQRWTNTKDIILSKIEAKFKRFRPPAYL